MEAACVLLLSSAASAFATGSPAGEAAQAPVVSQVSISPTSLSFPKQQIWTTSTGKIVRVTNTGVSVLNFVSIVASGDYSQTNNCGSSLQPNAFCTLTVTFTPSSSGQRPGYITLSDSDSTVLQTVILSGLGFTPGSKVAVSPAIASVTPVQTEQYQATYNGIGTASVTWSVDGIAGGSSTVGTISTAGLYRPSAVAGPHLISAALIQNPSQNGSARIVVTNNAGVFTWDNDPAHTGQNLNEVVLNTGNVNATQFGKIFSLPVDGQVYAQPLYVEGVSIPGQGTHNVLYRCHRK